MLNDGARIIDLAIRSSALVALKVGCLVYLDEGSMLLLILFIINRMITKRDFSGLIITKKSVTV